MKVLQRIFLAGVASALLLGSAASSARASSMLVDSDQGSIVQFTAVNNGGSITFSFSGNESVTLINGDPVSGVSAQFDSAITINETRSGTTVVITGQSPNPFNKAFTDSTGTANLTYNLQTTTSAITDPNALSLKGVVLSTGTTDTYNYSPLLGGLMQLSFNGSNFTGTGVNSVSTFFDTTGATWKGGVVFSEAAPIPEPAALALFGIGLSGVFTIRRLLVRRTHA